MTADSKIRAGVEARLLSLHVTPAADGSDVGIFDAAIAKAKDTVFAVSGFEAVPEALIGAVCDLAAADYAEYILTSDASDGQIGTRTDGDFSLRYKDGTSRVERLLELTEKLRRDGMSAINVYRRIRW